MAEIIAFPRACARPVTTRPGRFARAHADRLRSMIVTGCALSLIAAGHPLPF